MSAIVIGTPFGSRSTAPRSTTPRSIAPRSIAPRSSAAGSAASSSAPRLRITRRGRAVVATLVALPLAVAAVVIGIGQQAAAEQHSTSQSSYTYVTVQPGDSLWSIAGDVAPSADRRDTIDSIVDLNQLTSGELVAGERIAVPTDLGR